MMRIAVAILFLFISFSIQAQEKRRHEIALDAAPLLRAPGSFSMVYRYYLDNNLAVRAKASITYEHSSNDVTDESVTPVIAASRSTTNTSGDVVNTQLRIGLQRNIDFDKWRFYAGADVLYGFNRTEHTTEVLTPGAYGTGRDKSHTTISESSYGFAPVLGISYKVNSRFLVSLENSFALRYARNASSQQTDYYFTPVKGTESLNSTLTSTSSGDKTSIDFSPAAYLGLFVGFLF